MKITKAKLKQIIKEELEVILTNEEATEMFGEGVKAQLEEGHGMCPSCEMDPCACPAMEEEKLNEDMATLMQNLTPENIELLAQVLIKMGTTFGVPMLAAALAKLGYEAFQAAKTATNAEEYIKMGKGDRLVDFLYNELTDYKDFRASDAPETSSAQFDATKKHRNMP